MSTVLEDVSAVESNSQSLPATAAPVIEPFRRSESGASNPSKAQLSIAQTKLIAADAAPTSAPLDQPLARLDLRGWLRFLRVGRVIGGLILYIFLDNYEARSKFMRRATKRDLETARQIGRRALLRAQLGACGSYLVDKFIRTLRLLVFRSGEDSARRERRLKKQGIWLRESLVKLGPSFIKLGQALATRADLLPLPYVKELETLQDSVPAFPTTVAYARIAEELGGSLADVFKEIDAEPIAAASLGQVYRARLHTGQEVAVKVQRPDLDRIVAGDIAILTRFARLGSSIPWIGENADWEGMLAEFDVTVHEEMDYVAEGKNADRFRSNFKDWPAIHVPRIYWTHSTKRVLTMQFVRGLKVTDVENLLARKISPVKVNRLLIKTYLKQLLEDGFFHADPHPGNLLVLDSGHLSFFDFGMVGRITPQLQSKMIDAFFHVVSKDVPGIAQDLIDLNFLKPGFDQELVRPVIESLFQHYLNLKLGEVNFKELTYDLADVVYDYPFRLPANFTYIMRALMTLEGLGLVTDPEFNFFDTAKPFAKEFMLKREGKQFRQMLVGKFTGRDENGKIDWSKMWKLTKMAVKMYLEK